MYVVQDQYPGLQVTFEELAPLVITQEQVLPELETSETEVVIVKEETTIKEAPALHSRGLPVDVV